MSKENEREKSEGWGRVMISTCDWVPRGSFSLSIKEGETLVNIYTGSCLELGSSYFANGEARILVRSGTDVYYIFNQDDIKDTETRKKILPKEINLDDIAD